MRLVEGLVEARGQAWDVGTAAGEAKGSGRMIKATGFEEVLVDDAGRWVTGGRGSPGVWEQAPDANRTGEQKESETAEKKELPAIEA